MSCRKWAQLAKAIILVMILVGCSSSKISVAPTILPLTTTPTQVSTVPPNPIPTTVNISSSDSETVTGALDEGIVFSKTYGNTTSQTGFYITSTRDGGHLIAGSANGCWMLKLDTNGVTVWDSSFNEELGVEFQLEGASFWCWLARQTPDGGYVAMGTGYDANFGQYRKNFIITLGQQGDLVSSQLIAEKGTKTPYLDKDGNLIWLTSFGIPREVRETLDGGYIIVGHFEQSSPDSNMHMIKTDENGAYIWDKNLCQDKNIHQAWEEEVVCSYNYVRDVIQLQDGSFVMTGVDNGAWLLKTDPNGNIEWVRSYERESSGGYAIIQMSDGGFLVASEKYVDQKQKDGMLIKTDSEGNLQWSRFFGGDKDDSFMAMEQRLNGEIIIMGRTESFDAGTYLWLLGIDSGVLK